MTPSFKHGDPVFKSVFGADWDRLPPVMLRHYANRAFCNDLARAEGVLKVESSWLGRLLKPFLWLTGILVPYEGDNIPVTVDFVTKDSENSFAFDRVFHFPGRPPVRFYSKLIPVGGGEMVERMNGGMCWRSEYSWNGHKILLRHKGYALNIFHFYLPLPLTWLFGAGYAEETPLDDESFSMLMEVRHPLFGKIFGYSGNFRMTKDVA